MATSKPIDGGFFRETGKQESVGEISERNIICTKQAIDEAAARFRAKRGLHDPRKSRISIREECEVMSYPPPLKYLIIAYSTMQTHAPINECIGFHSFGPIGIAV